MSTIRKYILNIALTILVLCSILGAIVSGSIVYDNISDGKVTAALQKRMEFTPVINVGEIIDHTVMLLNNNWYDKLETYAQEMNMSYYVSTPTGSTIIYSEDWYDNVGKGSAYEIRGTGYNKAYKLKIIFLDEVVDQGKVVTFELWNKLTSIGWGSVVICLFCIALLVISLWILLSNVGTQYKVFLLLGLLAGIEIVVLFFAKEGIVKRMLISLILEKILLFTIISIYLKKLYAIQQKAVNEQLKSDRMKTELISNVSHDIKTPLTSIINFSDLITQEQTENTTITEYAEHLHKQSIRLKELLEALIEAAKASSGAVEMDIVPCKVKTLLEQCIVEYEDKLNTRGISLIDSIPAENLMIMGDVKALRRIFENLLTNIYKYAMPNSRAYIEVKQEDGMVGISFKNMSEEAINLSAEELTERFVRGDASRHSEGHGLGLSIVKSLMDLMNGRLEFSADCDLFMAKLLFPEYVGEESKK